MNDNIMRAYARGYYHGRAFGVEENPYSGQTQAEEHAAYTAGYEAGVSEYSEGEA